MNLINKAIAAAENDELASDWRKEQAQYAPVIRELVARVAATQSAAHGILALRKEIENITRLLPANVDCSGVWAALDAAQAKQWGQSNG